MRLELHPEARAELRSAALWYEERRPGLGDEFISAISASLDRVSDARHSTGLVDAREALSVVRVGRPWAFQTARRTLTQYTRTLKHG